jgi:hypothetical protein
MPEHSILPITRFSFLFVLINWRWPLPPGHASSSVASDIAGPGSEEQVRHVAVTIGHRGDHPTLVAIESRNSGRQLFSHLASLDLEPGAQLALQPAYSA